MTQYIIRKILVAFPTLLIISVLIFAVLALAPGDPLAQFALNPAIPASTRNRIREQFGIEAAQAVAGHATSEMTDHYSSVMNNLAEQTVAAAG